MIAAPTVAVEAMAARAQVALRGCLLAAECGTAHEWKQAPPCAHSSRYPWSPVTRGPSGEARSLSIRRHLVLAAAHLLSSAPAAEALLGLVAASQRDPKSCFQLERPPTKRFPCLARTRHLVVIPHLISHQLVV